MCDDVVRCRAMREEISMKQPAISRDERRIDSSRETHEGKWEDVPLNDPGDLGEDWDVVLSEYLHW